MLLFDKLIQALSCSDRSTEPLAWPTIQNWISDNLQALHREKNEQAPISVMELRRQWRPDGEEVTASFGHAGRVFDPLFSKTWSRVSLAPDLRKIFGEADRTRITI